MDNTNLSEFVVKKFIAYYNDLVRQLKIERTNPDTNKSELAIIKLQDVQELLNNIRVSELVILSTTANKVWKQYEDLLVEQLYPVMVEFLGLEDITK